MYHSRCRQPPEFRLIGHCCNEDWVVCHYRIVAIIAPCYKIIYLASNFLFNVCFVPHFVVVSIYYTKKEEISSSSNEWIGWDQSPRLSDKWSRKCMFSAAFRSHAKCLPPHNDPIGLDQSIVSAECWQLGKLELRLWKEQNNSNKDTLNGYKKSHSKNVNRNPSLANSIWSTGN